MKLLKQSFSGVLCFVLLLSTTAGVAAPQAGGQAAQDANLTATELDNLVAPIALYPDALLAQILAGATYPDQITAANDWLKKNPNLKDDQLMAAVDKQSWDPGVKALTQFPSVLENMSKNIAWTSALGEAAFYQQKDVMAAVQRLRKQAKAAGNLKSGEQIKVVQQDPQTIVIQPAAPTVVYVPQYNPTVVYGTPYNPPGYSSGDMAAAAAISFGVGMLVGAAIANNNHYGWGYGGWGCGWHGGTVVYQKNVYVSRSAVYAGGYHGAYRGAVATPYNRANYNSGNVNVNRGGNTVNNVNINTGGNTNINNNRQNVNTNNTNVNNRTANTSSRDAWRNSQGGGAANTARPSTADRGYGQQKAASTNSSAFSGYNKGGNTRAESNRGKSSFSGGSARTSGAAHSGGGRRR